jgi:hypothetical protein
VETSIVANPARFGQVAHSQPSRGRRSDICIGHIATRRDAKIYAASIITAEDFREIVLSLQGAIERAHMGHPDFRANGRIFASLHANELSGTVKLTPEEQRELVRAHSKVFTPAAGAWGRQGWTNVTLSEVDGPTARAAVLLAWQNVIDKPGRRSAKPRTARTTRPSRKRRR